MGKPLCSCVVAVVVGGRGTTASSLLEGERRDDERVGLRELVVEVEADEGEERERESEREREKSWPAT